MKIGLVLMAVTAFGIMEVFYESWWGMLPGLLVGLYVYRIWKKNYLEKRRKKELLEFKNFIVAMQSSMEAGASIENALVRAADEMEKMYGEKQRIIGEVRILKNQLKLNQSLEHALEEMAGRMKLDEVQEFVDTTLLLRRRGGNILRMMKETVDRIVASIELNQELEVMVAAKQLEQRIMVFMPMALILLLRVSDPSLIERLYGNTAGVMIMTIALGLNVLADMWGRKIVGGICK